MQQVFIIQDCKLLTKTDQVNIYNESAFIYACRNAHIEIAKWLKDIWLPIDNKNKTNNTAFLYVCRFGYFELAQWLYNEGVNI